MISQVSSAGSPYPSPAENRRPSDTEQKIPTEKEQQEVEKLEARDREVRQHEQAHLSAGGAYVRGGASYRFERGPDNKQYAVGGKVSIDASQGRTPEETIQKAQVVRRAALAPATPSPKDRSVASKAAAMESDARQKLSEEQQKQVEEAGGQKETTAERSDPTKGINTKVSIAKVSKAYEKAMPDIDEIEPASEPMSRSNGSYSGTASLDMTL